MALRDNHLYEFDHFRLDADSRLLLKDGATVRLSPKAIETLLVLVQRRMQVVEKDQLLKEVWPDSFVEEGSLSRNIHELRKVLGDDSSEPRYIETIPRRGYRFLGDVTVVETAGFPPSHARIGPQPSSPRPLISRARWLAVATGFVGVMLIIRPGLRTLDWPVLLPLVGAVLWASYQILTRLAARRDSADTSLIWSALVALVATTFVGPIGWQWPTAQAWALMIVIALLGAIAHYALIKALDHAEAGAVQPYSYTLLVWVTLLGALMFGDSPDAWTILGAAIVVASGLYTWHHDRQAVVVAST